MESIAVVDLNQALKNLLAVDWILLVDCSHYDIAANLIALDHTVVVADIFHLLLRYLMWLQLAVSV